MALLPESKMMKIIEDFEKQKNELGKKRKDTDKSSPNLDLGKHIWSDHQDCKEIIDLKAWCEENGKSTIWKEIKRDIRSRQIRIDLEKKKIDYKLRVNSGRDLNGYQVVGKNPVFEMFYGMIRITFPEKIFDHSVTTIFEVFDKVEEIMHTPIPTAILRDLENHGHFNIFYEKIRDVFIKNKIPILWKFVIGSFTVKSIGSFDPSSKAWKIQSTI